MFSPGDKVWNCFEATNHCPPLLLYTVQAQPNRGPQCIPSSPTGCLIWQPARLPSYKHFWTPFMCLIHMPMCFAQTARKISVEVNNQRVRKCNVHFSWATWTWSWSGNTAQVPRLPSHEGPVQNGSQCKLLADWEHVGIRGCLSIQGGTGSTGQICVKDGFKKAEDLAATDGSQRLLLWGPLKML